MTRRPPAASAATTARHAARAATAPGTGQRGRRPPGRRRRLGRRTSLLDALRGIVGGRRGRCELLAEDAGTLHPQGGHGRLIGQPADKIGKSVSLNGHVRSDGRCGRNGRPDWPFLVPFWPLVAGSSESDAATTRRLWPFPTDCTWPFVTHRRMVRTDTPAPLAASGTDSRSVMADPA